MHGVDFDTVSSSRVRMHMISSAEFAAATTSNNAQYPQQDSANLVPIVMFSRLLSAFFRILFGHFAFLFVSIDERYDDLIVPVEKRDQATLSVSCFCVPLCTKAAD